MAARRGCGSPPSRQPARLWETRPPRPPPSVSGLRRAALGAPVPAAVPAAPPPAPRSPPPPLPPPPAAGAHVAPLRPARPLARRAGRGPGLGSHARGGRGRRGGARGAKTLQKRCVSERKKTVFPRVLSFFFPKHDQDGRRPRPQTPHGAGGRAGFLSGQPGLLGETMGGQWGPRGLLGDVVPRPGLPGARLGSRQSPSPPAPPPGAPRACSPHPGPLSPRPSAAPVQIGTREGAGV